ncbi:MAG: AAA family ATPase [Ruminococcaceae bacterium]|nr:AAA family ATPase [Oscillospiraceae bacterium]
MDLLIGNRPIWNTLLSAIREKRVAGCYLIEGADGTGKLTVARLAAAALCCTAPGDDASPCLSCHSCISILTGNHIDVTEVRPEEEGKRISVEQIREMLRFTHITSTEGEWRIFIIDESQNMKKESQNALLKSIEEPGNKTVFFLLTNDKTKLLPTVRSRAVSLRTTPLSDTEMRLALEQEKVGPERLNEIILLANGSLGKARELMADELILGFRKVVLDYFLVIMNGGGFTKLSLVIPPATTTRKDLALILPLMKSALRDLICYRTEGSTSPNFFTDLKFLRDLSSILSVPEAIKLFNTCDNLLRSAEQNVNVFSALSGFHLIAQNLTKEEKEPF